MTILILLFLIISGVNAQEAEDSSAPLTDPDIVRMAGMTFSQSFKTLESRLNGETDTLKYSISSAGIHYGSFTGGRLGFVSDVNVCVPFLIDYETDEMIGSGGFSLAYLGGIGWNLWRGKTGIQPYAGFHIGYTLLSEDPIDQKQSNHILTFGLGTGSRLFYTLKDKNHLYLSLGMNIDTMEFSSASYDSREIKLQYNLSYLISIGYGWSS